VLKEYLLEIDSFPYYDTTEVNYKVLKAYQKNDTVLLKNLIKQIREVKKQESVWSVMDTCIHQLKLQDLHVDEAYRFIFHPPFCTTPISVTITKKGDSANLHFLLYQNGYDTVICRIISEYDKKLTTEEWEEFRSKLWSGDIWGLKRENDIHGVDGSNLTFIGYQSGKFWNTPDKISYGKRWVYSSLNEALRFALMKSGNKKGCYWIQ